MLVPTSGPTNFRDLVSSMYIIEKIDEGSTLVRYPPRVVSERLVDGKWYFRTDAHLFSIGSP